MLINLIMSGERQSAHCLAIFTAIVTPILIPTFHILIFSSLWGKREVSEKKCSCSCWDEAFKGPYKTEFTHYPPGFKHIYFNATPTTLLLWILTVGMVLVFYESIRRFTTLVFTKSMRGSMGILFLTSVYSHYYSWWSLWNNLNDGSFTSWSHQVFFTLTDLLSTAIVFRHLDKEQELTSFPMTVVFTIGAFHVWCNFFDQFAENVILGYGAAHQVLRDFAFLISDLVHCVVALREIYLEAKRKEISFKEAFLSENNLKIMLVLIPVMFLIVIIFPPSGQLFKAE